MELFLNRLGKALSTLRKNGLLNGSRRGFNYLSIFLRSFFVRPGDILFITGGVGDSARFRAYNVSEELNINGFKSSVTVAGNPFILGLAGKFKIFIFHRTIFTPKIAELIKKIKAQNKKIIFDTDDLIYDPQYLNYNEYYKNAIMPEKKQFEKGIGSEIINDSYVEVCTTTTSYLAEKLKGGGKQVFIVKNKLSQKDLEMAERIMEHETCSIKYETRNMEHEANRKKDENCYMLNASCCIRLGYFSGTAGHDKNFAVITEALVEILEKYEKVKLFLAGPLQIPEKLNRFSDRIDKSVLVDRKKHFKNISHVDINLAPLETGNPFCEAKSELKFFEAGIVSVPTVAVHNQTFGETIIDGIDGYLASNKEEWVQKISNLIEDENLRKLMGEKAHAKSLSQYTTRNAKSDEYYSYLRSKLGHKT